MLWIQEDEIRKHYLPINIQPYRQGSGVFQSYDVKDIRYGNFEDFIRVLISHKTRHNILATLIHFLSG